MERQEWLVAELAVELENGRVLLLDVRPPEDVVAGHIPGSWLIPAPALRDRISDPDDALCQALRRMPSPVAVVAGDEARLAAVAATLDEHAMRIVGISGEIAAWSREGRPLNHGLDH